MMRICLICIMLQGLLFAESKYNFILQSHVESSVSERTLRKERFFKKIEKESIPNCVLRLYKYLPYEFEELTTTVYSVHELVGGHYIGKQFNCREIKINKKIVLDVSVTYFSVDTDTVKKYHNEIISYIKNTKFIFFENSPYYEGRAFGVLWDIRGERLGEPMFRFEEGYKNDKNVKNPLYHYLIKASNKKCKPPIPIIPDMEGNTIYYKLEK